MAEFKNPNQQGGQDHNSLLMMMLVMVAVIFGVQYYHMKHAAPTASPTAPAAAGSQSAPAAPTPAASATAPATTAPAKAAKALSVKAAAAPTVPVVQGAAETTTVVENELYRIEFSNRGGEVRSWILKGQTDNEGQPLDLVHAAAAEQFGYPLSLYTPDAALGSKLRQALYVASAQRTVEAPGTLSFSYQDGEVKVTKTFTFDQTYVIHADVQISQNGAPVRVALSWPGGLGDAESVGAYTDSHVETMSNGSIDHVDGKKVSSGGTINGPLDLGGVSDTYFTAIFLPDQPQTASLVTFNNQINIAKLPNGAVWRGGHHATAPKESEGTTPVQILGAAVVDQTGHLDTRLFVGPKYKEVLQNIHTAAGHSLEPVLNFGFWGFIGKYLFVSLELIHDHVASNWGWAVILLTLILTLLLVPTRVMSMRSAIKMQRIQPMVNAIKAKYKNPKATDPKAAEMNAEVMALYKEHDVNMFGGCLPGILPMPLIFAFYTMLMHVVELRHAHWYWLHDLTQPDPTHILAIFTVITMFLVQFYTPSPGVDPTQQKMMAFMMPLVSGYFTWSYAAGLALYLTASSLVNIVQQLIMNRTRLGTEMREIATKRARRKGTTIQGKR